MANDSRIQELRRRVEREPASLAFAQLAEEYRRAGRDREAIAACRAGLVHHPEYLSARVTLGRALIGVGDLDSAERELSQVLRGAPDNLAALKAIAEVYMLGGRLEEALRSYRAALRVVGRDPAIEEAIARIEQAPARQADAETSSPEAPAPPARELRPEERTLAALERWLERIGEERDRRTEWGPQS
ncbi:MAG: tetratricopeptide repeat protein [Vicinamibacterales bacterium]